MPPMFVPTAMDDVIKESLIYATEDPLTHLLQSAVDYFTPSWRRPSVLEFCHTIVTFPPQDCNIRVSVSGSFEKTTAQIVRAIARRDLGKKPKKTKENIIQ